MLANLLRWHLPVFHSHILDTPTDGSIVMVALSSAVGNSRDNDWPIYSLVLVCLIYSVFVCDKQLLPPFLLVWFSAAACHIDMTEPR